MTTAGIAGGSIMTGKATTVAAVALSLAAGYLGGALSGPGIAPTSDTEVEELRRRVAALESSEPAFISSERRLSAADEHRAEQDRRILALEADLAAALKKTADLTARAAGEPTAGEIDADLERLRDLDTAKLLAEVFRLTRHAQKTRARPDAEAALRACEVALARQLETEQRTDALLYEGRAHMVVEDHTNAESSFREALQTAGPSSRKGRIAAHDLAYTALRQNDLNTAIEWYRSIVSQPDTPTPDRVWYRYQAAALAGQAGDTARAREEYLSLIDEFGASEEKGIAKTVGFCRKDLKRLDKIERR
jgi:hypothetical protein